MSLLVLVLRPEPGAEATAARARALGLEPVIAPLFAMRPLAWTAPAEIVDAVMITSANAARLAGDALTSFADHPCYTVGEASAAAAKEAGFTDIRVGPDDGAALMDLMAADGVKTAFHPCGLDHLRLHHEDVATCDVPVYAADAVDRLPPNAEEALGRGAIAMIHSPRAGALFGSLVGDRRGAIAIAAISAKAARAAGPGWARVAVAAKPRDEALLELVAKLCQTGDRE